MVFGFTVDAVVLELAFVFVMIVLPSYLSRALSTYLLVFAGLLAMAISLATFTHKRFVNPWCESYWSSNVKSVRNIFASKIKYEGFEVWIFF